MGNQTKEKMPFSYHAAIRDGFKDAKVAPPRKPGDKYITIWKPREGRPIYREIEVTTGNYHDYIP